jgi:hypothetical protein
MVYCLAGAFDCEDSRNIVAITHDFEQADPPLSILCCNLSISSLSPSRLPIKEYVNKGIKKVAASTHPIDFG